MERLSPEWTALWLNDKNASPFQSPYWVISWWKVFGAGELAVIAAWDNEELTGLIPLYIRRDESDGKRKLVFIGTGNTDYLDLIVREGYEETILNAFRRFLDSNKDQWDECRLTGLRECSLFLKLNYPEHSEVNRINAAPSVRLRDSFDDYLLKLSPQFRKNIIRAESNLSKTGTLNLRLSSEVTLNSDLNILYELHAKSWGEKNSPGVLSDSSVKKFLQEACRGLLEKKFLRLYSLMFDDKAIASVITFLSPAGLLYYIGGYEPEYRKYSPGSLIIYYILQELCGSGTGRFDFLTGRESYKYKWCAEDEYIYELNIIGGKQILKGIR
ncbi:MAG: GNAT family N-acetyltransferase [Syntrophothermus sp.]